IKFQFFFSVVWALVALKQAYLGYSDVDHYYMRSWLSPTASAQFFLDLDAGNDPRPFGMGSGSPSLNSIACFGFYGIWRAFSNSNLNGMRLALLKRFVYLTGGLLIALTMFESRLKTSIVALILCWGFYAAYRSRILTVSLYVSALTAFILLIANST